MTLGGMTENLAKSIYSNFEYKNKDRERDIKKDVREEFNRIDRRGYRDDQEIWEAGMNTIDSYILQLKYSKGLRVNNEKFGVKNGKATLMTSENIYKNEALSYFKKARNDLVRKYNAVTGIKITSSAYNRQLINDIAYDIDKAENDALKKIKLKCNPMQEQTNAIEKSSVVRDRNGNVKVASNGTDVVRQKPMFTQDKKGTLTFTDRSNKPKIHEALKGLFPKGKNYKYKINYKGCTNQNIKNKMMQLTGTGQCWISYDEQTKTYLLRNKDGKPIQSRALIWEGVTLQRDELIQWNTYEEEEKRKENIGKVEASAKSVIKPEKDPKLKDMVGDIPDSLKKKLEELGNEDYRRFIIETEKRLGVILRYGKQHGYELHTNPVSKLQVSSGLMEVHFINGDTEPDVKVWENSNDSKIENAGKYILGEKLYNMLDGNESDYLTYLTARVKKLWGGKFDELTVKDDLLETKPNYNLKDSERLPEKTVGTVNYGIKILKQFIENHRESEGDSRADNDDRYLVSMKKELENLEYTIESRRETTKKEDMEAVINKSIDKLANYWAAYWGYQSPAPEKEKIKNALLGSTKQEQIEAIRKMAKGKRIFGDVTESSFLADEISTNGEAVKTDKVVIDPETGKPILDEDGNPILETSMQGGLEVENAAINEKFQNINKLLYTDLVYNSNNKLASSEKQIKIIKDLYTAAGDTTGEQIIGVLIQNNMLPEEWRYDKDVKEKAKNIAESLRQKEKAANSLSINDIKANEQKEKRQLEMKSNKTEEDLQRLQALQYLEEHPTEANKIHQTSLEKMKDEIRYGEINDLVRNSLASIFVDKGGGAKGKNADIYNDIVGYGFWDVSDETAKVMGEILTEIVITVVVAVCTMGTGTLIVAGALRGASMLARSARWVKLANNISKAVKLLNTGAKGWKVANAAGKTTQILGKGTALLIEGTTFNAASNVIHSAMNGTSLDSLNLNPVAKENIQTAAFLGALSVSGRLTQGLMKLGGKTKLTINLSKGLEKAHLTAPAKFTTGLVSEMGSMLAAEQAVNFTFGHDVIDPETGEVVTSHAPTLPTGQERIQMVGMILAFKAVKPGLWQKYEKKLNDGTLEICRSVKKNEVLIRDPKTGKVENVQNLIDGQYNNYKPTPEQYQLRNHNKWREKQSKYELEILEAQEKIGELPENLRSEAMKKLLEAGDIVNLSPNDIKRIQREIGLKGKEVNGIFDSKSLAKLKEYVDGKKTGPKLSVEKPGDTQNTNNQELLRRREELQKKKESHEKRKSELEKRKSELERRRDELLRQREQNRRSLDGQENAVGKITDILKQGNIITIDGLKYKFTGVKNGKAEFIIDKAAKKSAEKSGKTFSEKVEVSSLEEFLDSRFNLEPGKKGTNSRRYQKLNELINDKVEPLDRLQNKIKNKQGEISTLEEEIARLERGRNTTAHNDYFEQHKNEIVGKNVRIDGVKYSAEHVNADGSIQFKEVDGKGNFTVSSFKQLAEKGDYINGFSDYLDANGKPKTQGRKMSKSELDNHELIRNLISGEKGYLDSRNLSETIKQKRSDLQTAQQELKGLQDKLPASQARQQAIDARAKKGAEINKELGKLETELEGVNRDLSEAERLINKYQGELDGLPGETAPQEGGGKEPEIRENTVEEPVVREEPAPEVEGAPRGETAEEILADEFDAKALNEGITINGDTYKLEYRENTTQNKNRKGEFVWIKNGKVIRSVKAETRSLPDNADGNRVRSEYNRLREEYVRSKKSGNSIVDRSISSENVDLTLENNPELIESRLNQELGNGGNFENVKLDWITKAQFETGVFIEGVHRRFKNISLKPNIKLPKEFLKKMGDKLVDMKNTWGEKLGEYHRKLIDKYNSYIERKLAEKGEEVEIKNEEIKSIEREEQERRQREEQERRQREEQERRQREEQERRQREEQERRQREEQERRQREEGEEGQDADVKVLYAEIQQAELNMLRNLNKGRNEQVYLETFGEPKNVISLGNGENLYVSNCLSVGERKFVVGFSKKGGELKLRLFYRSKSEGARRSCPGKRALKISPDGEIIGGGGFSKGENIPNSSYETTTRVINELQYKFDSLPQEKTRYNPIDFNRVGPNILEPEMASTIKIDKLFNGPKNDTVNYIAGRTSAEVKDMYRRLGENVDMSEMKMVEGKGYTYEHQYLGTIEVQICRLNYNGKNLDFSFAKVKNDPENRVRIEGVNYADAKITSFGIYDKQINAAPLTGKPIDYATYNSRQVPKDRQGKRYGENYMDIRDLYQENPFVKKFKEISKGEKNKAQEKPQERRQREEQERRQREEQERRQREEQERRQREEQERRQRESNEGKDDIYSKTMSQQEKIEFNNAKRTDKAEFYINEGFEPKNVIHLPSGEKLYVTDKIVKGGSRPQIVGYALENGKMNIRLFYRSNSEGCRRSSGGARQVDGAYSKGEFIKNSSYETTTKVDYKLGELFDKLNPSENFSKRWNAIEGNLWEESGGTREEILKKEMQKNIKVESVMFPDLPKGGAVYFYEKKPPQEVINGYNKLVPKGLNYTEMRTIPEKGYSYNHNYLGAVNVEATQMKYKGKDIYIYFARAKNSPDKVWIENIVYADAKINSFGVYDKQINAGPLIAKPIDYESQVPIGWTGNGEYYGGFMGFRADGYIDIRDLYQGNPIIKEYKKLSGEKSYENDGREYSEGKQRRGEQRDRAETRNVGTQQYSIGQEVYVKRSAGGESRARVESYNPRTKEYTVRWEEGGERLEKTVKSESLREVQAQEYQLGQEVYVKRSAGGESRARIESYNPRTKKYKVVWKEGGERLQKTVTSESLRMAA